MIELAPLIKYPKKNNNYKRYQAEKRRVIEEDDEKRRIKELKEEMKKKLSKEDYNVWAANFYYKNHKEEILERQRKNKELKKKMDLEEFEDLSKEYPPEKKERDKELDLLYKYKDDYTTTKGEFKMYWWQTPLVYINKKYVPAIKDAIKIIPNDWIEKSITGRLREQRKVYEYLKPHLSEIWRYDYFIKKTQRRLNKLQYDTRMWTKLRELQEKREVSQNVMCMVLDAIHNDKWIETLPYYWMCWICGDRLYTSMGQIFVISPYNNYRYLTEENFDKVHNDTLEYLKHKTYNCALAIGWHCYLIKVPKEVIQNEDWEKVVLEYDYYMVPYKAKTKWKVKTMDYDLLYKRY